MESTDSPEIPDRGETSDISGLPSGGLNDKKLVVGGIEKIHNDSKKHPLEKKN